MVTVRRALAGDVLAMGDCMVASWLEAHRGHLPEHLWEARRRDWTADVSAAGWARVLGEIDGGIRPPGTLLVADDVDDGGVVGIGMITVHETVADVDALYVAPARQGARIGAALIGRLATAVAHRCPTVELSVLAANAPARRFYERIGGELVGSSFFDEAGTSLPTAIYRWSTGDLLDLGPGSAARGG